MELKSYLDKQGIKAPDFAQKAGISVPAVYKYLKGSLPGKEMMDKIYRATNGQVTANDFYNLPQPKSANHG